MMVSVFKNALTKYPSAELSIIEIFSSEREGSFKDVVESYRASKSKEEKIMIPCFTPAGTFTERNDESIKQPTGVICLDIDAKDNDCNLESIKQRLVNSNKCFCIHKSVGGEGLAVYYKVKNYRLCHHSQYYEFFEDAFSKINVNVDKSCKNLSRLRFISYDNELYLNTESEEIEIEVKQKVIKNENEEIDSDSFRKLIDRILDINIDICDDYHEWVRVAFAISKTLGEEGREAFHQISSLGVKYDSKACDKLYDYSLRNLDGSRERFVNKSTLFYICQQYGIAINDL